MTRDLDTREEAVMAMFLRDFRMCGAIFGFEQKYHTRDQEVMVYHSRSEKRNEDIERYVFHAGDEMVGVLVNEQVGPYYHLMAVFVKPEYRRQGIATKLIKCAADYRHPFYYYLEYEVTPKGYLWLPTVKDFIKH